MKKILSLLVIAALLLGAATVVFAEGAALENPTPANVVQNLQVASYAAKKVRLSWDAPEGGADAYEVRYGTSADYDAAAVASARQSDVKDEDEAPTTRGLARFSSEALMVPRLKATTPQAAISILAKAMEANGFISDGDELTRLALERESVLSTRMGDGTAVPHVRGVEGGALAFALGISPSGIKWDDSGEKVNFVVLSAIPSAGSAFFLKLMSDLMAVFRRKTGRTALLAATDAAEVWKVLVRGTCRVIR